MGTIITTDGTQIPYGILAKHQDMLVDGVASDRFATVLVHGMVRQNQPGQVSQLSRVSSRYLTSPVVFRVERGQSNGKKRRLQLIEPRVLARLCVMVLAVGAVIA